MKDVIIGNVKALPGKITYGFLDVFEHPIGTVERLPVIIAQGSKDGPILWLTANMHGDEYTGIPVIHTLLETINLTELKGTIVAIPTLNPAGSRTMSRYPYYDKKDPNRLFPDGNPFKEKQTKESEMQKMVISDEKNSDTKIAIISEKIIEVSSIDEENPNYPIIDPLAKYDNDDLYPSIQEIIWQRIFDIIKESASILIDLHNAFIKSIPFIFLDRVLYNHELGEQAKKEAEKLYHETERLVKAFGFTIIRETTPIKYINKKLHRSLSGATLNTLRIPSFTVELGMYREVDQDVVVAAVKGIENVLKAAQMLPGTLNKISEIPIIANEKNVRYIGHPRKVLSNN